MNRSGQGRPHTPTVLKLLTGSRYANTNPHEARPSVEMPQCPSHLSKEAKKEWRRTSKLLLELGLLTQIDRSMLAAYCQVWSRWVEAEQALAKTGTIVLNTVTKLPMRNPYLRVAKEAMDQMTRLLAEFGMSPSSRSRIHATPKPIENKLDKFIKKAI